MMRISDLKQFAVMFLFLKIIYFVYVDRGDIEVSLVMFIIIILKINSLFSKVAATGGNNINNKNNINMIYIEILNVK